MNNQNDLDMTQNINEDDDLRGKYLTFKVENGEYGIEIACVTEIIGVQNITPIPHTHHYVKGIINLRGTIVPVIDMRLRFNMEELDYTDRTCIVVLGIGDMRIGLIVDEVQEVADIGEGNIQPPPKTTGNQVNNHYVKGIGVVGDSVKQLIDANSIFEEDNAASFLN